MQNELEKSKNYFKQLKSDYEDLFQTEAGKRVLEDIKKAGFYYTETFHENPYWSAKHQGMRALALHIVSMTEHKSENKEQKEVEK